MAIVKVAQGTYRIPKSDWMQWFNQDENKPFCDPRSVFFCKQSQFQVNSTFQLEDFLTGEMEETSTYHCVKEAEETTSEEEQTEGGDGTDQEGDDSAAGDGDTDTSGGSSEETEEETVIETEIFRGEWSNSATNQHLEIDSYKYLQIDISAVVEKSEETKIAMYTTCGY